MIQCLLFALNELARDVTTGTISSSSSSAFIRPNSIQISSIGPMDAHMLSNTRRRKLSFSWHSPPRLTRLPTYFSKELYDDDESDTVESERSQVA